MASAVTTTPERLSILSNCGTAVISLDLSPTATCPSTWRCSAAQAETRCSREGSRRPVKRAPQGLAVERHHTRPALGKVAHERQKAGVELLWIKQSEHPRERVVAGDAVFQGQELAQERLLGLSEQRHVRAVLAPAQHGAQGNHQDGVQIVKPGVARPWVLQIRKDRPKSFHRSTLPIPSRLPRRRPPARSRNRNSQVQSPWDRRSPGFLNAGRSARKWRAQIE